jgi:hypothetical protein
MVTAADNFQPERSQSRERLALGTAATSGPTVFFEGPFWPELPSHSERSRNCTAVLAQSAVTFE